MLAIWSVSKAVSALRFATAVHNLAEIQRLLSSAPAFWNAVAMRSADTAFETDQLCARSLLATRPHFSYNWSFRAALSVKQILFAVVLEAL
jgi:hypothetical protein